MNTYFYQAALWCEDCAGEIPRTRSDDSDDSPQGPYPDGGGESDSPQHCEGCRVFLENALTDYGIAYVRRALAAGRGNPAVLAAWRDYYSDHLNEGKESTP